MKTLPPEPYTNVFDCTRYVKLSEYNYQLRAAMVAAYEEGKQAALAEPSEQPVYWQWRRKDKPWSNEYIFAMELQATTDDSEVRKLFAHPASKPAISKSETTQAIEQAIDAMRPMRGMIVFDQAMAVLQKILDAPSKPAPLTELTDENRFDVLYAHGYERTQDNLALFRAIEAAVWEKLA